MAYEDLKPCDYYQGRIGSLKNERSPYIPWWMELSEFVTPHRGRYFIQDHNRGSQNRWNKIINSRATQALRTARAGMIAGALSPAQPWFALQTPDPDLMDFAPVKIWLHQVQRLILSILNESNFYVMVPSMVGELLLYGTGCMTHVDDFVNVAHFYTHTIGSYMIGQNEKFEVDTLAREYEQQVSQMVAQFGYDAVSDKVRTAYDRGQYDQWYPVTHFIGPNRDHNPTKKLSRYKLFSSVYYEPDQLTKEIYLRNKGFDQFPAYCPRWDVTGEDVWASDCPGMTSLGDIKGMQIKERRKAQAIDKQVSPPLKGPAALKNVPVSSLPGGLTTYDTDGSKEGLSPIYMVNTNLRDLKEDISGDESRIDDAFFVKLFLAISNMDGVQPRNQLELSKRDQERLLQLGPVLQRLYGEFAGKVIDRTFAQCAAATPTLLPPPPPELQGKALKVKYLSPLALAQEAAATGAIERMATFVAGLVGGGFPHAADKFDADAAVEEYGNTIGIPPKLIVPDEVVAQRRNAAQQQQQQQMKLAAANQMADAAAKGGAAAKSAAQATTPNGGNVLQAISQAVQQRGTQNLFQTPGK